MVFCNNCGKPLAEGAKFCAECGTAVGATGTAQTAVAEVPIEPISKENKAIIKDFFEEVAAREDAWKGESQNISVDGVLKDIGSIFGKSFKVAFGGDNAETALCSDGAKAEGEYIKSFDVPNDVASLIEFLTFAIPKYNPSITDEQGYNEKFINESWLSKIHEIYTKLTLALPANSAELAKFKGIIENIGISPVSSAQSKAVQEEQAKKYGVFSIGNQVQAQLREVQNLQFGGRPIEIQNQMNTLFSQISAIPGKWFRTQSQNGLYKAIKEKLEFGIMQLNSLGATTEAAFFQKKFDKLK